MSCLEILLGNGGIQAYEDAYKLQRGEAGVVGVFAQLGTVDQEPLSRVLAANYRSMLVVLIVEDAGCRTRLEQLMSKSRQAS